jgi:hypothetical protein
MSEKPKVRITTVARVQVTVEVTVGSWGPECEISQVYRQGAESAMGRIRAAIGNSGHASNMKIVGVGKVLAITTSLESQL